MRLDKLEVIELRKSGQSYGQISASLHIPKSTLSVWLKDIKLSQIAQKKIRSRTNLTAISKLIERNKNQTILAADRQEKIRSLAKAESKKLLLDPLFLAGVSLYWAEGYKQGALGSKWKSIDFANSDPEMIRLMVNFFTKFFEFKKTEIKVQIMLHNPKDSTAAINFWQHLTGIPKTNFFKVSTAISRASLQKRNKKLQYGTIHLRVNKVESFFRLIGWIDGLKEKLL
ncbi:MAG: hypothetical protein WC467_03845 [Patescibacteria group bacterium]